MRGNPGRHASGSRASPLLTVPPEPPPDPADEALTTSPSARPDAPSTRREELRSFLFFTVVMAPVLAVLIVAGYGFLVWMYQMLAGPPGS